MMIYLLSYHIIQLQIIVPNNKNMSKISIIIRIELFTVHINIMFLITLITK